MESKLIVVGIISLLLGLVIGFSMGTYKALDYCVNTGLHFLELRNISVDVNQALLKTGIYMYKNNIGRLVNCTST